MSRRVFTSFRISTSVAKPRSNLDIKYMRPVKLGPGNRLDRDDAHIPELTYDSDARPGSSEPRKQHSPRVSQCWHRSWNSASSPVSLHKWNRRRGVPLLRSSLALKCGKPLTTLLPTHRVPFSGKVPLGFVPTVLTLSTWHLTATVVVGHALLAQILSKGWGPKMSRCHWGADPPTQQRKIDLDQY